MKYLEFQTLETLNAALTCIDTGDTRVFGRIECYSCKNTTDDKKLAAFFREKYNSQNQISILDDATTTSTKINPIAISNKLGNSTTADKIEVSSFGGAINDNDDDMTTTTLDLKGTGGRHTGSNNGQLGGFLPSPTSPPFLFNKFTSASLSPPKVMMDVLQSKEFTKKTMFYLLATLNAAFPDYDFSDVKPDCFISVPSIDPVINNVNTTLFNMGNERFAKIAGNSIWESINEIINLDKCEIYQFNPTLEIEPDAEDGNVWSFYYFFFNKSMKRIIFFTCRAVSFMAPIQPMENPEAMMDEEDRNPFIRQYSDERFGITIKD